MTLSIIGAGFGRTGTNSIKKALEHLGIGPCHHMEEVFANPSQLPYWQLAADGESVDWNKVFEDYNSAIDWPSAHYWRELADFYPDSKILLSVRPFESWWGSFSGTIKQTLENRDSMTDEYPRSVGDMAYKIIAEQTFSGQMSEKKAVLLAFEQRIEDVKNTIESDRLLTFDVTDGWTPLCEFLNLPIPNLEFPRSNSTKEFQKSFDDDGSSSD